MKHIEVIVKDRVVLLDLEDVALFESANWQINTYGYLYNAGKVFAGYGNIVLLHRLVLGYVGQLHVDHINGNKFDNRKCNLRLVNSSQNQMNSVKRAGCSSQYKGVGWHKPTAKWKAQIMINKKHIHLGRFDDEKEAALAYDKKALELFGEHALLNFPIKEVQNA